MKKLKLISIRVNPETLNKIDQFAASTSYRNRSSVINALLDNCISMIHPDDFYKLADPFISDAKGVKIRLRFEQAE